MMRQTLAWPLRGHAGITADATHWTLSVAIQPPDPRETPEYLRLMPGRVGEIRAVLPLAARRCATLKAELAGTGRHAVESPGAGIRIRVGVPGEGICIVPCRWEYGTSLYDVSRVDDLIAALDRAAELGERLVELCRAPAPH